MLYFPYPVKHGGLFKNRYDLITDHKLEKSGDPNFKFHDQLSDASEIYSYFQFVKRNPYSPDYFGNLLTDNEDWKWTASIADLSNFYKGIKSIIDNKINSSYFMTNTGGHHADNAHYELFCPINHLFFITEILNYQDNFPQIYWVDTDAHFGNGDKKLYDSYSIKMRNETNNLSGVSFHNDAENLVSPGYKGIRYNNNISNSKFLEILEKNIQIPSGTKYFLWFIGTDIINDDYGNNKNISLEVIPKMLEMIKRKSEEIKCKWIIIQTGGSIKENIQISIDAFYKFTA